MFLSLLDLNSIAVIVVVIPRFYWGFPSVLEGNSRKTTWIVNSFSLKDVISSQNFYSHPL